MIKSPLLFFSMALDNTPQLNIGRLFLIDYESEGIIGRWMCTSGLGDHQHQEGYETQGGGCIPPNYQTTNVKLYWVHTRPVWQDLNGLKTNTYAIDPNEVRLRDGRKRSELLIHRSRFSAPQSGSLGCIVLPDTEFQDFERDFAEECGYLERVRMVVGYVF